MLEETVYTEALGSHSLTENRILSNCDQVNSDATKVDKHRRAGCDNSFVFNHSMKTKVMAEVRVSLDQTVRL